MTPQDQAAERVLDDDAIEDLHAARDLRHAAGSTVDPLDPTEVDGFELPGAVVPAGELRVDLDPIHEWEFTCAGCFLVRDRVQRRQRDPDLCLDCI